VHRANSGSLCSLRVSVDGEFVTHAQGDGVVLATPTGSTAYSLSSGGSMVHPTVPSILLTPVCPHSLSFRPCVLPEHVEVTLTVPEHTRCHPSVTFDGGASRGIQMLGGDRLVVTASPWPMPSISATSTTADWFRTVDACFRWNHQPGARGFEDAREERLSEADPRPRY